MKSQTQKLVVLILVLAFASIGSGFRMCTENYQALRMAGLLALLLTSFVPMPLKMVKNSYTSPSFREPC